MYSLLKPVDNIVPSSLNQCNVNIKLNLLKTDYYYLNNLQCCTHLLLQQLLSNLNLVEAGDGVGK